MQGHAKLPSAAPLSSERNTPDWCEALDIATAEDVAAHLASCVGGATVADIEGLLIADVAQVCG